MDWIITKWLRLSFIPPAWRGRMSWSWAGHGNILFSPWRSWKTYWGDTALALWLSSELEDCHYCLHLPVFPPTIIFSLFSSGLPLSHFLLCFLLACCIHGFDHSTSVGCYAKCLTHFFSVQSNHFFMQFSLDCPEDEGNKLLKNISNQLSAVSASYPRTL